MGAAIGLTACNERLPLPLLHAREPKCRSVRLPSAQPRFLSPALESHAQEVSRHQDTRDTMASPLPGNIENASHTASTHNNSAQSTARAILEDK